MLNGVVLSLPPALTDGGRGATLAFICHLSGHVTNIRLFSCEMLHCATSACSVFLIGAFSLKTDDESCGTELKLRPYKQKQ